MCSFCCVPYKGSTVLSPFFNARFRFSTACSFPNRKDRCVQGKASTQWYGVTRFIQKKKKK